MNGILLVDKPLHWTSHDVVGCVRRRTRLSKVGHAGTLDPLATGLLVLLLGGATRLSASLTADDKEYIGTFTLGVSTDTDDREGKIISQSDCSHLTRSAVEAQMRLLTGKIDQVPPAYSAVKTGGKKLYELARKGIAVTVPAKSVVVQIFEITAFELPEVSFRVVCSKGTYIRSLARDLGAQLGCGAMLSKLVRTRSGVYRLEDAVPADRLKQMNADEILRLAR